MVRPIPVVIALLLATVLVAPAATAGLPIDLYTPSPDRGEDGEDKDDGGEELSCAVAAWDDPGAGVEPFVDLAAVGARIGTPAGSVTAAIYPYSCTYVVLQIADPNRPLPREPLPEGTPLPDEGHLPLLP